jgi:hypothetical protein
VRQNKNSFPWEINEKFFYNFNGHQRLLTLS